MIPARIMANTGARLGRGRNLPSTGPGSESDADDGQSTVVGWAVPAKRRESDRLRAALPERLRVQSQISGTIKQEDLPESSKTCSLGSVLY